MNSEARRRRVISEAIGSDGTAGAGAANVHSAAHCDRGRMIAALAESVGHDIKAHLYRRFRMKWLRFWFYFSRAVSIGIYLLAPKTALTFYLFAAALGFSWLSTVPPSAGLVAKLFGTRHLATLFGLTLLSHQIGGFFGAWLGGIALTRFGDYSWMWYADIVLALGAAIVNLPIREAQVRAHRVREQPA
jgi:predicted MFS family arabinose efflux permease